MKKGHIFVADNARIIGDVRIDKNVNIWYGVVIRADLDYIEIVENTNIQDNAVIHVDPNLPTIIGSNVTIGHGAIVHGAIISSNVLIGMGAIILSGAKIGEGSVIGAGTLVKEGKEIEPFSLVVGVPGRAIRRLDKSVINTIKSHADKYTEIAKKNLKKKEQ